MKQRIKRGLFISFVFLTINFPLCAQPVGSNEQFAYIGMTLTELFERFGVPKTVVAARGIEHWQDDVIFQYTDADFFIPRDRVWQVRRTSIQGIRNRERKAAVLLTLGDKAEDRGNYVLFPVSNKDWPLILRVNFSDSGQVNVIYIYRPDL
jgi:hypothetical protein